MTFRVSWAVSAAVAVYLALPGLALAAKQQTWPQTFFDGGHTGFNPKEKKLSPANVSGLQVKWGQSGLNGATAFVLDGGVLYAQVRNNSGPGSIVAMDAVTGKLKWAVSTGVGYNYSPPTTIAVAEGLVFTACGELDSGGLLVTGICAYSESNGKTAWSYFAPCNCGPESALDTPLTYDNGTIYFAYGYGTGTGYSHYLLALDAKKGTQQWAYAIGGNNAVSGAAPAVSGGKVYFGGDCGASGFGVCALSQEDGSIVWGSTTNADVRQLTANEDGVYAQICSDGPGLVKLDAATGSQRWTFGPAGCGGGTHLGPVAISGKEVYYSEDHLYALDAKNGREKWVTSGQAPLSAPSIANGVVYVAGGTAGDGSQASASAYDASKGTELWATQQGTPWTFPAPLVANGMLYDSADRTCGDVCAYSLKGR